jgi:folate-binding protein YgfZ
MPQSTAAALILPGMHVLEIEGAEAVLFLQSQLSSDVSALRPGLAQWSAWLNPKGRVIALGVLLQLQPDRLWLLLPDHPAQSLADALGRYVLRRKAKLRARPELAVAAGFEATPAPPAPLAEIALDVRPARRLWVLESTDLPVADLEFAERWRSRDIACGLPRLDAEGGSHTAHMLSLDRLGALSLSKGCYPGQEIVARTHYLGQSKRGLGYLKLGAGASAPIAGTSVMRAGIVVGEVLCAATLEDGVHVQAVLASDADAKLEVESQPAERVQLEAAPLPRVPD